MDSKSGFSNKPDVSLDESTDFSRYSASRSVVGSAKMSSFGDTFNSSRQSSRVLPEKPFNFPRDSRIQKAQREPTSERSENLQRQGSCFDKEYAEKFNGKYEVGRAESSFRDYSSRTRGSATPQPGRDNSRSFWTMEDRKTYQKTFTPTSVPTSAGLSENVSLQITGLTGFDPEYSLRKLCQGFHVVSITAPCDSLTGKTLGKAGIVVKSTETNLNQLKIHLLSKGLELSQKPKPLGKKNNYAELAKVNFLDPFVSSSTCKTPARHHLETSENLFGSSSGVGRYHSRKRVDDKQALVLHSWNELRRPSKPSNSLKSLASVPSYMRSTQSSIQKLKKLT